MVPRRSGLPRMWSGASRQHAGEPETVRGLDRRGAALDGLRKIVEPGDGVVVLDRPADRAGRRDAGDRVRGVGGVGAVAVLEIDGERQLGRPVERRRVLDDLVERRFAVEAAEREREPELVVASAWNPSAASTRADRRPRVGIRNGSPACSAANAAAFSLLAHRLRRPGSACPAARPSARCRRGFARRRRRGSRGSRSP